jgi:signal transduction histidine kinase
MRTIRSQSVTDTGDNRRRPRLVKTPRQDPQSPEAAGAPDDRFFRQLVGGLRNGVIAIHRDGTLALMNDEACRMFALQRDEAVVGRPFVEVFRNRHDLVRVLSGAFELATLPNRAELRLTDLDRVVGYTMSLVRSEHGRTIGAVLFCKDLTLVEQAAERDRLRDRLASLGEMAAGIAHELKNPLAGIEVMAGLLRRQVPDSPDAQALLADILSEAKLANAIVVEMLEFVRPVRLQVEQTDITQVLQQSITNAEVKASRRDTHVSLEIADELPLIDADASQLCQVFTNLLTNAFEAVTGRGHVRVRAMLDAHDDARHSDGDDGAEPAPSIILEVVDDGPGVPDELSDRIFNPFFTTKTTGSGLGLPIVRKIVDAHDGRIDLYSAPGRGTRFRVTLPVASKSSWFK